MPFSWHDELFWFLCASALPAYLAVVCFRSQRSAAERSLGWLLACQSAWALGQTLELASTSLTLKLWLDGLQYLPMCATFAWSLVFAHHFAGKPVNFWLVGFYCLVATPACLFYMSAPLHGWSRQDAHIVPGVPFNTLSYPFTSGDYFLIISGFVASAIATATAAQRLGRVDPAHGAAALPVLFGVSLPTLVIIPALAFDFKLFGQRDLSFAVFGISGLCILWGLKRGRIAVVPVARELLFDRSPDPAWVLDQDGVILELNTAATTLLELPHKDAAVFTRLVELQTQQLDTKQLLSAVAQTHPVVVYTHSQRALRVQSHHLRDLDVHLVVARDVTDEVAADELRRERQSTLEHLVEVRNQALFTTENKFRAIFERTFQMMFLLAKDGTVLDANRAALATSPTHDGNVTGVPFWSSPWFSHSSELQNALQQAVAHAAQGEQVRLPVLHLGEKGARLAVDFSLTPILGSDGQVSMLICEGRDVTELKQAEEHLRQAAKMEALGTLAGGIAHDFNNLLTVITGNVSFLRDEANSQLQLESLAEVETAATHAASLTQQLLAFGRKSMLTPKLLYVQHELEAAVRMLARIIPANIAIHQHVAQDVGSILFDSAQFHQVVLNLAINARDAMPHGGELELRAETFQKAAAAEQAETWIRITIADTGLGMSDEVRARIFEPFFTTKELGRGTGLGLAMVYGAILQQGGNMEVTSEVGRGTCFALHLKQAQAAPTEAPSASRIRAASRSGTIYLIEDQAAILRTIALSLERAGHQVHLFGCAEDLLNAASLGRPDLVLTDAVMPGLSGFELVSRARGRWPGVACIVMSGYSQDQLVQEAQAQGVLFLRKPFVGDELQRRVDEVLRQQSRERTAQA